MSTGLYYLTHQQFFKQTRSDGKNEVSHNLPGVCMILFYSNKCNYCAPVIETFQQLAGKIQGVKFAIVNITADDMAVDQIFRGSTTPISYVPYIAIYKDGKFNLEYRGPRDVNSLARASSEIQSKITENKQFVEGSTCTTKQGVEGYCAQGYDEDDEEDDVCFTYDEAFAGKVCDAKTGRCVSFKQAYGVN